MPDLDPPIVRHCIDTWKYVTPVRKKQHPLHPSKVAAIIAEIEKLHAAGFIYPITYTSWVTNPILINKKQGTICIYTDFHDLNHDCPKDNFPTPFIDQIIDDCANHKAFSFMDGSLATIKSKSIQHISIKPLLPHGVLFLIMSFLLD